MKKLIALLLAMAMLLLMLAGCGGKDEDGKSNEDEEVVEEKDNEDEEDEEEDKESKDDDEDEDKESKEEDNEDEESEDEESEKEDEEEETEDEKTPAEEAEAGDLLDTPEVVFDVDNVEQLYIYFTMPGEGDEVKSMEIALDQVTEDAYVLYVSDGLLKLDEIVYEVDDEGITKYYKDAFMEAFLVESELTQAELEAETATIFELLGMFMLSSVESDGIQYEKTDEIALELTGETLTYNMLQDGEIACKISIDKATGLMVSMKDAEGNAIYTVMEIKTSDLDIPEYK